MPRWRLSSDGRAAISSEEGRLLEGEGVLGRPVVLVHDPWRPVPARGGHLGGEASLPDRTDLDRRGDVACFTTPRSNTPCNSWAAPFCGCGCRPTNQALISVPP